MKILVENFDQMYSPSMGKSLLAVLVLLWVVATLTSCQNSRQRAAAGPIPESAQVITENLKDLYMKVSASPQPDQRKLMLRMADQASNGKELMLTMRAASGVSGSNDQIRSVVTAKMMKVGTLDQLTDYEKQYEVGPESARPYVERMFELGSAQSDPRAWQRIRAAASRLKLPDLEQAAQAKVNELTRP